MGSKNQILPTATLITLLLAASISGCGGGIRGASAAKSGDCHDFPARRHHRLRLWTDRASHRWRCALHLDRGLRHTAARPDLGNQHGSPRTPAKKEPLS